jgi:hypothetical protein
MEPDPDLQPVVFWLNLAAAQQKPKTKANEWFR